jgi:hypothetical protein
LAWDVQPILFYTLECPALLRELKLQTIVADAPFFQFNPINFSLYTILAI